MAPEHIVIVIIGGKTAAGRNGNLGEQDALGKLLLRDGGCLRVTGAFLILGKPVVGKPSQVFGRKVPHGLVPGFLICNQPLGGVAGAGP